MSLRKNIIREKLKVVDDGVEDNETMQMLDALELVVSSCVDAMHPHDVSGFSEMTCYRKFATILDNFLRDTMLTVDE